MTRLMLFTWNAHKVPFCSSDPLCRPINFWKHFEENIKLYQPDIVVFGSQEERCGHMLRSTIHSSFLPDRMKGLGYQMFSGDSLDCGHQEAIQTSVYSRVPIKVVTDQPNYYLTKGIITSKKGALGTTILIGNKSLLLCNMHLPRKGNRKGLFDETLSWLYYTPGVKHLLVFGSMNSHYRGHQSLEQVLRDPELAVEEDEFTHVIAEHDLKEGVYETGFDFQPTCKLSTHRQVVRKSWDGDDLDESIQGLQLDGELLSQSHEATVSDFTHSWGWCDRIFYGDLLQTNLLQCEVYKRIDDPNTSLKELDHAMVMGVYHLK